MAIDDGTAAEVATVIADYTLSRFSFLNGWQKESPGGMDFPELTEAEIIACDKVADQYIQGRKGELNAK